MRAFNAAARAFPFADPGDVHIPIEVTRLGEPSGAAWVAPAGPAKIDAATMAMPTTGITGLNPIRIIRPHYGAYACWMPSTEPAPLKVALVTLGCARNEVDSEELAGRLDANGWTLVDDADDADAVVVNTCGFVESAKKDSIDTLLAYSESSTKKQAVVAVGCLAQRYGKDLASELPEADAVLGFDDYPDISDRLRSIVAGEPHVPHAPTDRRLLLPVTPIDRQDSIGEVPGHGEGRVRLDNSPIAPLKLASGCDRRCTFCAIPSFRGSFVSRRPSDVLDEARWLTQNGVSELLLVSENSTSYGKDLGDMRLLETLLPEIAGVADGLRVRVSYLQPAEMRPGLIDAIAETDGVADYFDMSFQHASTSVLRRMRRFGGTEDFLDLIERIREVAPHAGIRSNVIVGFPGETEEDLFELEEFIANAELDAIGVFGYSDEDGTEAVNLDGKLDHDEIRRRVERITALVDDVVALRAEQRVGDIVDVLVEELEDGNIARGRAAHQGAEDGDTVVSLHRDARIGGVIRARVEAADGVDLIATEVTE